MICFVALLAMLSLCLDFCPDISIRESILMWAGKVCVWSDCRLRRSGANQDGLPLCYVFVSYLFDMFGVSAAMLT